MSLGAQPEDGATRFRVWAPVSQTVAVVLYEDRAGERVGSIHALSPEEGGYFGGIIPGASPGTLYRFRLDGRDEYPDPATRFQPLGVHGPSEVVDPTVYRWRDHGWSGVPPEDLVLYEMHVGTFTRGGTFASAVARLTELADLGVTAVEVMPIANFPGRRNWGYDGVNLFAPATAYGGPAEFKRFVDEAHSLGLAVVLDVVYNHLGPEGNYLPAVTGGRFFTDRHHTPWGRAVNYDGPGSPGVRDFVLQNALHWCIEYHVDGLRLDATHAIFDDSERHILEEIAHAIHALPGPRRHAIAEDDRNEPRLVQPPEAGGYGFDAVWADDFHHELRSAVAGDDHGYFARYRGTTADLADTLRVGWSPSSTGPERLGRMRRGAVRPRLETLPPSTFVHCIQNHDQVGNRATGERLNHDIPLSVYRAISALLLVTPYTPLVWMGQEWAASSPFLYFTDHPEELGRRVAEGRREEFRDFPTFRDPEARTQIPDPQAEETFSRSVLRWEERTEPPHAGVRELYRTLLHLRRRHPAFREGTRGSFGAEALSDGALAVRRRGLGAEALVVVNLRGEIRMRTTSLEVTTPSSGGAWRPVLVTEEPRFGGDGGWGTLEADGTLHLVQPCALLLEG